MKFDVAVVGAGIIGAACAFEAARAGLRVMVIEQNSPASGTTAAGMGHIVAMDDSEAQFALTRLGRDLWAELSGELPADCEYVTCGTLWVAADEEEMAEVIRKSHFYRSRGVEVDVLDSRQLHEAERNLKEGLTGALLVSGDAVISPPCAARFLLTHSNITLRIGSATSLTNTSVCLADGSSISAEFIINATGVNANQLTPEIPIVIQPRKGHLLLRECNPDFIHHQLVELGYLKSAHSAAVDSVAFNVQPRSSGQILIGSSRQFGAPSAEIDQEIVSAMLARAIAYMPGIAHLPTVRSWTGFRPATPDNLPLIGVVPGHTNVFVAAGHEGLGTTTSLATARLLIDQILNRAGAIPVESYRPNRLTGRP